MADNQNRIFKQIIELPKTISDAVKKVLREDRASQGGGGGGNGPGLPNAPRTAAGAGAADQVAKNADIASKQARKAAAEKQLQDFEDAQVDFESKRRKLAEKAAFSRNELDKQRDEAYAKKAIGESAQRERDVLEAKASHMDAYTRSNSSIDDEIAIKDSQIKSLSDEYGASEEAATKSIGELNTSNADMTNLEKDNLKLTRSMRKLRDEISGIDNELLKAMDVAPVKKMEGEVKKATGLFSKLKTVAGGVRLVAGGVGAGLGAVAGGIMAARAMDPTEEIANLNIQTGMSLRNLSALRQAAREAGLEFDEVKASLVAVPQILGEAFSGDSGAIELLTRMKLSVKDLKDMSIDDAITSVLLQIGRLEATPQAVPLISAIVGEDVQSKLLPALRRMADEGIDYFAEKAVAAGTMVTDSTAKTAKDTNNAIRDMQSSLDGLATSVAQKTGPQLEYLAKTLKEMIPIISEVATGLISIATGAVKGTKSAIEYVGEKAGNLASLTFVNKDYMGTRAKQIQYDEKKQRELEASFPDYTGSRTKQTKKNAQERELDSQVAGLLPTTVTKESIQLYGKQLGDLPPPIPALKIGAPLPKSNPLPPPIPTQQPFYSDYFDITKTPAKLPDLVLPPVIKAGGAQSVEVMKDSVASLTNELSLLQQKLAELESIQSLLNQQQSVKSAVDIAELEVDLAQGRIDAEDLLAAKLKVADDNAQNEIDMLGEKEDLLGSIIKKSEAIAKLDPNQIVNVDSFKAELLAVREQTSLIQEQLSSDRAAILRETAQSSLDASKTVAQSQIDLEVELGNVAVGRAKAIADKLRDFQIELAKIQSMSGEGKAKALADFQAKLLLVEKGIQAEEFFAKESLKFDNERALLEGAATEGSFAQIQLAERLYTLEKARIPVLKSLLQTQLELAQASGDVVKVAAIQNNIAQLEVLDKKLGETKDAYVVLETAAKDALTDGLNQFMVDLIDGTGGLEDAFRSLAMSIVRSMGEVAAKAITTAIVMRIFGAAAGGGGGAAPVAAAGGGRIGDLQAQRLAGGGRVMGGGTVTSDSVPTLLSNQEFVVRGSSALQHGAYDFLNRFNSIGMKAITEYNGVDASAYGDVGGVSKVVGSGGVGGGNSSLSVGLEDGLILRQLDTPAGYKIVMKAIGSNRNQAKKLLG